MPVSKLSLTLNGRLGQKAYFQFVGHILAIRILAIVVVQVRPDWVFLLQTDFLFVLLAVFNGNRMKDFSVALGRGWGAIVLVSLFLPVGGLVLWPQPYDTAQPFDAVSS